NPPLTRFIWLCMVTPIATRHYCPIAAPSSQGAPSSLSATRNPYRKGSLKIADTTLNAELAETAEPINLGEFCGLCVDRRQFCNVLLERDACAELHLERARNSGGRSDAAQIPIGFVVGCRLVRAVEVAVPEIGSVEYVVELGKQRDLPLRSQRDVLGHPSAEVDQRVTARTTHAARYLTGAKAHVVAVAGWTQNLKVSIRARVRASELRVRPASRRRQVW